MLSCSFGVMPRSRKSAVPDRFGRAFPAADALAALPDAMRHEAALLAQEAGLVPPKGSLLGPAPAPHSFPIDPYTSAAPAKTSRQMVAEFMEERLEPCEGAWLPIENIRAALHVFCSDQGQPTPSDISLSRGMIARFGRPAGSGYVKGFSGLAIKGGRS
ncbi:MAG: hypothetical protein ACK4GT_00210 [Pararhodobacter sp.]